MTNDDLRKRFNWDIGQIEIIEKTVKHLQGQHNQATHGKSKKEIGLSEEFTDFEMSKLSGDLGAQYRNDLGVDDPWNQEIFVELRRRSYLGDDEANKFVETIREYRLNVGEDPDKTFLALHKHLPTKHNQKNAR